MCYATKIMIMELYGDIEKGCDMQKVDNCTRKETKKIIAGRYISCASRSHYIRASSIIGVLGVLT